MNRREGLRWLVGAALLAAPAAGARAHPMGNFSINHFARISAGWRRVDIRYVLDLAEIPTMAERQTMVGDAYAKRRVGDLAEGLHLSVAGRPAALALRHWSMERRPGAGGLPTLRIAMDLTTAGLPPLARGAAYQAAYQDANFAERSGWKEIVIVSGRDAAVRYASVPALGRSRELTAYPSDVVPPQDVAATFTAVAGAVDPSWEGATVAAPAATAATPRDAFTQAIARRELTPGLMALGLLIALVFGAGHALAPGHGKTLVAAYLVGSRGTARHAAILGLTVTITHTLGVFALGLAALLAARAVNTDRLYAALSLLSGAGVLCVGGALFVQRVRAALTHEPVHTHEHAHEHDEGGGHVHSHGGHSHTHAIPGSDGRTVTLRSLLALGVSGGLLPCPSALIVLLSAVALHRVTYGMALVAAFSLGLAATLTAVGVAFVYLGRTVGLRWRLDSRWLRLLPIGSALVVSGIGAAICYSALLGTGWVRGGRIGI